jgi:hypothetical protein
MNAEQRMVYMQAQIASALIEMEAMKAENLRREHLGQSIAYDGDAFLALIPKYMLGHNSIITELVGY